MLRWWSVSARAEECEAITGRVAMASTSRTVSSATCEMSTIIPRRFISRTTSRPKSVRPPCTPGDGSEQSARGIGPVGVLGVGQGHVAHALSVEFAQQREAVLDRIATLDAHQHREAALLDRAAHVAGAGRQHRALRMRRDLRLDRRDHVEGAPRRPAALGRGLADVVRGDVDREEGRIEAAAARAIEVEVGAVVAVVAPGQRAGISRDHVGAARAVALAADVEAHVEHRRGHVDVPVDHDRVVVSRRTLGRHRLCRRHRQCQRHAANAHLPLPIDRWRQSSRPAAKACRTAGRRSAR